MRVLGIDEVGRGCWAGPLVVGAAIIEKPIEGLTDSKLIRKNVREQLAQAVKLNAMAYSYGWVTSEQIDELGITKAIGLAMRDAISSIDVSWDEIIIDGNYNFVPDIANVKTLIKADLLVPAVSAASIIAKVKRDSWMTENAAKLYPQYGFDKHVGYGTLYHRNMLEKYGLCPIHRKSFKPIKKFIL